MRRVKVFRWGREIRESYKMSWQKDNFAGSQGLEGSKFSNGPEKSEKVIKCYGEKKTLPVVRV